MNFVFFKHKTANEMRISDWIQTCALPISLPDLRHRGGHHRRRDFGPDALRTHGAGRPVSGDLVRRRFVRRGAAPLERAHHRARPHHGLLHGHASDHRRLPHLLPPPPHPRPGHPLPPPPHHHLPPPPPPPPPP